MATDNGDHVAKIEIRRLVLAELTPAKTVVFDAFAGKGEMWAAVWRHAAGYVGCDEYWPDDARTMFVSDNRRVLRAIDLAPFTCFDLDAYGDPWTAAIIIAARRPRLTRGQRLGLVVTDGGWLGFAMSGRLAPAMRLATGITPERLGLAQLGVTKHQTTAAGRAQTKAARVKRFDDLVTRASQRIAQQMGGHIVKEWRAVSAHTPETHGSHMRYRGLVIEGAPGG